MGYSEKMNYYVVIYLTIIELHLRNEARSVHIIIKINSLRLIEPQVN